MLGYAFMGKAHVNAYRTLPYMIQPPPALPRLEAIAGRDAVAVREAAERYGFRKSYRVWRLDRKAAGSGALGDLGAHVVDLARFLVGELKSVAALTRTFIKERPLPTASKVPRAARAAAGGKRAPVDVDDTFAAAIELEGGATGTLEATRLALGRKNHMGFEINGSRASLSFDLERLNELNLYRGDGRPETKGWTEVLVTEPEHPFIKNWWPPGHVIGWEHTFVHEIAHLLDAIANDRDVAPLGATFEDGYRAAVICDAILASAREGRRVEVGPPRSRGQRSTTTGPP